MNPPVTNLLEQASRRIHDEGGRMTSQRRLILEVLESYGDHPSAEEIYLRACESDTTLHLSTVYRTLRWLEDEGLVSPRWFEEDRRQERFDTVVSPDQEHNHFRCRICNRIVEFASPVIKQILQDFVAENGGCVENATLILYGVCARCESEMPQRQ